MSSKHHLNQAGNYIQGHFQNHGVQLNGNNISVGGNFVINTHLNEKNTEIECRRALRNGLSDPIDDRAKILSLKPRLITATCDWITTDARYKTWRNIRTRSQLLWVSGGQARGKTMLAIFLTQEFDRLAQHAGEITVLYYFIDRQDKRDTAVHVMRGLIWRLLAIRKDLIKHLLEEYEIQRETTFGPNSIETLWRVFEKMVRDPTAGQVYCVIDGLDSCTEDSLRRLIGRIRDFFLDEPQMVVDEGQEESFGVSGAPRRPGSRVGAGLKMMLVSREEPEWLIEHLKEFPRVSIGGNSAKKAGKTGVYSAKSGKKPPKLAEVAKSIIRKQHFEKSSKSEPVLTEIRDSSSGDHQPVLVADPNSAATSSLSAQKFGPASGTGIQSHPASPHQTSYTSGAFMLSSGPPSGREMSIAPLLRPSDGGDLGPVDEIGARNEPLAGSHPPAACAPLTSYHSASVTPVSEVTAASPSGQSAPERPEKPAVGFSSSYCSDGRASSSETVKQHSPAPEPSALPDLAELPTSPSHAYPQATPPSGTVVTSGPVVPEARNTAEPNEYMGASSAEVREDFEEAEEEGGDVDEDFNPSLRLYIEAKIEELANERQYATEVQSFVCEALEYRGDGTFLWVDFAIEELKKVHISAIEDTVNSLPPTLDEMYIRILLSSPPGLVDIVIGLLRWTVCARRPMDLLELTVALNLSHYSNQDAIALILNAVSACGNMIMVGEEDLTVNLVHQSLVDFLTGDSSQLLMDPRLARFHIRPSEVDGDITTFCISYLESGPFNDHAICQVENADLYNRHIIQYPFLPYAASFWPDHLRDASDPLLNLSSPFFLPKSKARKNWWHTYWAFTTGKGMFMAPRNFTVLHLAAYLNLIPIAQQVAQRGELQSRINKRDSHGSTPLDYAVALGHIPMFEFLIQHNAKQEPIGETVLELAVRKGQRDMVAYLLDMGWDVNLRTKQQNPLGSLYDMTRWLPGVFNEGLELNRDAWHMMFRDVGVQETPLHQAATYGHTAVIELLLERGAAVDVATTKGFTPLHSASYTGQTECVQLLLDHGANVYWVTTDQWLPLHYAAMRGKLPVVELFLDLGVPIDSLTIKSKSALHLAAYAGYAELVSYLVERGADVELKSYKGETPLHLATRHTKPQVIEVLLSLGADRNAMTNEGVTALQMAQASTLIDAKECLRILQTYGMEGYVPWQPPQQPNTGLAAAQPVQTPGTDTMAANGEAGGRRASIAPSTRTFGHAAVPRSHAFQGFEATANISVQVHPPQQPSSAPYSQHLQEQHVLPGTTSGVLPVVQPSFGRAQSDPAPTASKFDYDANANIQHFTGQNSVYEHIHCPGVPPPPYTANVGCSPPITLPEKSPAWTSQANPSNTAPLWQQAPSIQPETSHPSSPPMYNASPVLRATPPQKSISALDQYAGTEQHTASTSSTSSPATTHLETGPARQQSRQSGMVQMLSSMKLSTTPSSAPVNLMSELPMPAPPNQISQQANLPTQQMYQPTTMASTPQYQAPQFQATQPPHLMSPFEPSSSVISPFQSATGPSRSFAPQQQYPNPVSFNQPPQSLVPPSPLHYTHGLNLQSTPSPYVTPQPQQAGQILVPTMASSVQGQQFPTPVQSPQFSGNSTASIYNAGYEYSAPALADPYNPQMGQMQSMGPSPNGLSFAPPPPSSLNKKKSFLGGLINR